MSVLGPTHIQTAAQPRTIPGSVAIAAYFGGRGAQCAWGVLVFGLAIFWWLAHDPQFSPFNGWWRLGPTAEVDGVVQSLIETDRENMGRTEWGMEMERVTTPGLHYGYVGPDGTPYTGVAMGLKHGYHESIANVGAPVRVIYSKADPEKSYVKGLEGADQSEYILKGGVFWVAVAAGLIALFAVFAGLRRGGALTRLLSRGELVQGRIVEITPIPVFSKFGVWRLRYALSGAHVAEAGVSCLIADNEMTGEDEPILCGPEASPKIFPLKLMPGGVHIDERNAVMEGATSSYNYLLLPALGTLGYVWFAFWAGGLMSPPWVF